MTESIWSVSLNISAQAAYQYSLRHAKAFGGPGMDKRNPNEIKNAGILAYQKSLETIVYTFVESDGKSDDDEEDVVPMFMGESELNSMGLISGIDSDSLRESVVEIVNNSISTTVTAFLATKGSFNDSRYWLLSSDETIEVEGKDCLIYIALPELLAGKKGEIQIAFADNIAAFIAVGGDTSILGYCKRVGHKIPQSKYKYCFPKGQHVTGFPVDKIQDFKSDMDILMKLITNKEKQKPASVKASDFSEIKFFTQKVIKTTDEKTAEEPVKKDGPKKEESKIPKEVDDEDEKKLEEAKKAVADLQKKKEKGKGKAK